MPEKLTIALARGDGIGPEITDACLHVFERAGVMDRVSFREVSMGEAEFEKGNTSGISDDAWKAVEDLGILLKGPMATPTGGGGKSINVTLRKSFGAFANLRHFQTLPGVETVFTKAGVNIDLVIVRENIEDTYGGIEHRLTEDVTQNLRLISAPGCDQVHRFAFESARRMGIGRVHCGHKANIMKITDGLFLSRFHEVGKDYPEIEKDDVIVDALCMNLVMYHGKHDMVVLPNLQGDIVSDLAAGLVGGLGFAPSANIGERIAIFEAVHGTAPDIAGRRDRQPNESAAVGAADAQAHRADRYGGGDQQRPAQGARGRDPHGRCQGPSRPGRDGGFRQGDRRSAWAGAHAGGGADGDGGRARVQAGGSARDEPDDADDHGDRHRACGVRHLSWVGPAPGRARDAARGDVRGDGAEAQAHLGARDAGVAHGVAVHGVRGSPPLSVRAA